MASPSPSQPTSRPDAPRKASSSSDKRASQPSHTDDDLKLPKRAQTFPAAQERESALTQRVDNAPDVFETAEEVSTPDAIEVTRASIEVDEVPIELVSLIDSFIESLSAKVHSAPPSIEKLSRMFQDFYGVASSHINTHVSALASRQSRDVSPAPSASSISSAASRLRSTIGGGDSASNSHGNNASKTAKTEAEQQMITTEELETRKAARRAMESKRGLLEEAVERRLCENIYHRIYRHRSTDDEALDDSLRSKTAALALLGIAPADLGLEGLNFGGDDTKEENDVSDGNKTQGMRAWLAAPKTELVKMSKSRYPLGKLGHLKVAHKNIVDILSSTHPSASADDILPVLILALTTVPPENLHVISDLHFIQYFRWEPKLSGEAAYCLTNLEAAITFLQGLDLAALRADENLSGPAKEAGGPKMGTFPPAYTTVSDEAAGAENARPEAPISSLKAATVFRNRRLSDIVNSPAQAFGLASDAVLTTADQGLKNISNSLGDSYKFLLGKIKERQDGPKEPIAVPRTLDDARRLVSTPEEDTANPSLGVDGGMDYLKHPGQREDRMLSMLGGRRDRSADSNRSGRSASSSKKVLFSNDPSRPAVGSSSSLPPAQSPAMIDQVRSLGTTFNPMARLSSLSRGLARNVPSPMSSPAATAKPAEGPGAEGGDLATAFPDIAAALPPKRAPPKIAPPNKRFMELQNPGDLKLSEVLDLLRDYRRLANALNNAGAFEEKQ